VRAVRIATVLLLASTATVASADASSLEVRVREQVSRFAGTMGVVAKNLDTGERIAINEDVRFPTASLIKVAVMVEAFHAIADGRLRRDQTVTLHDSDKAGDETVSALAPVVESDENGTAEEVSPEPAPSSAAT
jgi:beta-lactamase class A